jgi:hydrogenase expression/formation protein HypC
MCIGTPLRIVRTEGGAAWCANGSRAARLDLALVGDQPVGAWVLAYQGSAVRTLTEDEARQMTAALDALAAVLAGAVNVDAYFADLIEREPALPPHLAAGGS